MILPGLKSHTARVFCAESKWLNLTITILTLLRRMIAVPNVAVWIVVILGAPTMPPIVMTMSREVPKTEIDLIYLFCTHVIAKNRKPHAKKLPDIIVDNTPCDSVGDNLPEPHHGNICVAPVLVVTAPPRKKIDFYF